MLRSGLKRFHDQIEKTDIHRISGVLFVLLMALIGSKYNDGVYGDMAEYLNAPVRILLGELPYRDFWLLHPPGEVVLPAMIYGLFGVNVNAVMMCSLIVSCAVGVLSFRLGTLITRSRSWGLVAAALVFSNGVVCHRGYVYNHAYFLLLLWAAVIHLSPPCRGGRRSAYFLTGVFIGSAFLFRTYEVVPFLLALLIMILTQTVTAGQPFRNRLYPVLYLGSGMAAVLLPAIPFIWPFFRPMMKQIWVDSLQHGTANTISYMSAFGDSITRTVSGFRQVMEQMTISEGLQKLKITAEYLVTTLLYLLPAVMALASIAFFRRSGVSGDQKRTILFLWVWGSLNLIRALFRPGLWQMSPGLTIYYFMTVYFLKETCCRFRKGGGPFRRSAYLVFIVYSGLLICIPGIRMLISPVSSWFHQGVRLETTHGVMIFRDPIQGREARAVVRSIERETGEGDYIFINSWDTPPFYALTGRRNPTYYDSMIDFEQRPSSGREKLVCRQLAGKNVKMVIRHFRSTEDSIKFAMNVPIIQRYIRDSFRLAERLGSYEVLIPK
jgi:hypothetical protein